MPVLTDFFQKKGWAATCDGIEDCGGVVPAALGCLAFFAAIEDLIFFDHYYLLHKWDVGKRLGQHAYHHVYKYADQLNAFSGYSFAPQDGFSQGIALAVCTLFVPVPIAFVYTMVPETKGKTLEEMGEYFEELARKHPGPTLDGQEETHAAVELDDINPRGENL